MSLIEIKSFQRSDQILFFLKNRSIKSRFTLYFYIFKLFYQKKDRKEFVFQFWGRIIYRLPSAGLLQEFS